MKLETRHTILLTLVELSIFLRLPYKPSEGYVLSTNIIVPLTMLSLFLLMLTYTRAQMDLKVEYIYTIWEHVNIVRKYVFVVFCVNMDFCNRGLGLFIFVSMAYNFIQQKPSTLLRHVMFGISAMFQVLVVCRVLFQGNGIMLCWGFFEYMFLRELSEVSYMTQQIYLPWVLVMVN